MKTVRRTRHTPLRDRMIMDGWGPRVFDDPATVSFTDWEAAVNRDDYEAIPAEVDWGFSDEDLRTLAAVYRDGGPRVRERVLYVLEDCNFHTECALLEAEDYLGLAYRLAEVAAEVARAEWERF